MKIEEHIYDVNNLISNIEFPFISQENKKIIQELVEITHDFQEINQLYELFKINFEQMLFMYTLKPNDEIINNFNKPNNKKDLLTINALLINYISSAKTFIESIEKNLKCKSNEEKNEFKTKVISKIYDQNFSYRLLLRLRDYSQHGYLPVYMSEDNRCSFDIDQIINVQHFNFNKKILEELNNIRNEIIKKYKNNPRILFTRTIAEFHICIIIIYKKYIEEIKEKYKKTIVEFNKMIDKNPHIIYKSNNALNGYIFYNTNNGRFDCINSNDKSMEMFKTIEREINIEFKNEIKEFERCFNDIKNILDLSN